MVENHKHTGTDSPQIFGGNLENSPQPAPTTASGGVLSTGGTEAMTTADADILNNALIRLQEVISALQALGVMK